MNLAQNAEYLYKNFLCLFNLLQSNLFVAKLLFCCKATLLLQSYLFVAEQHFCCKATFLLQSYSFVAEQHFCCIATFLLQSNIFVAKQQFCNCFLVCNILLHAFNIQHIFITPSFSLFLLKLARIHLQVPFLLLSEFFLVQVLFQSLSHSNQFVETPLLLLLVQTTLVLDFTCIPSCCFEPWQVLNLDDFWVLSASTILPN